MLKAVRSVAERIQEQLDIESFARRDQGIIETLDALSIPAAVISRTGCLTRSATARALWKLPGRAIAIHSQRSPTPDASGIMRCHGCIRRLRGLRSALNTIS